MAGKIKNITGKRFGYLEILGYGYCSFTPAGKNVHFWKALCHLCGEEKYIRDSNINHPELKSCGCYRRKMRITHGALIGAKKNNNETKERMYRIWRGIKSRILNPGRKSFKDYGGRGLRLDSRWEQYENFKADMASSYQAHVLEFGEHNTTIERIDNNEGYGPNNCKWATYKEQNKNRRKVIIK